MNTSIVVEGSGRRRRRRHSAEFKAQVIAACQQPGVSSAAVALANGLNANMLRRWVIEAERPDQATVKPSAPKEEPPPAFVPLQLPAPTPEPDICIEINRAGTAIKVSWPAGAASQCAAWLRELLR